MTRLSRREALRMLAGTGAVTALGPLVRSARPRAEVPRRGGQVVVGLSQEPTVFNPLRPHIEVDRGVHFGIFDSLWRTDERAQFVRTRGRGPVGQETVGSRRTGSSTPSG